MSTFAFIISGYVLNLPLHIYNYPGTKFLTFGAKSLGGLNSQYFQT